MDTWVAFLFLKTKEAEKSWGAGWEYTSPVINGLPGTFPAYDKYLIEVGS